MLASWIAVAIGTVLTWWASSSLFDFTPALILRTVAFSELAAFVGLWITIRATQDQWMGKNYFKGTLKTWVLICCIYFGILLGGVPELRSWSRIAVLFIPLQLVHGLTAQIYGPLQDYLMRKRHQKTRSQSQNDVY